jgi:membrane protease YdiL (CAAX protease family)
MFFLFLVGGGLIYPLRWGNTRSGDVLTYVLIFFGVNVVSLITSGVVLVLANLIGLNTHINSPQPDMSFAGLLLYFASLAFLPAVLEEILFRGLLMQSLRRFGNYFALIASSVLFAAAHQNLIKFPAMLFGGLVLGYVALNTNSLMPSVVMHFFSNAGVLISGLLAERQSSPYFMFIILIVYAILGIIGLIIYMSGNNRIIRFKTENSGDSSLVFFTTIPIMLYLILIVCVMAISSGLIV